MGLPGSSAGKKSTCNAGDFGSIPGLRKITWRRGRLPTPVFKSFPRGSDGKESACKAGDLGSILGQEDPLKQGMATHSSILAWRIPVDRGAWQATVHGDAKSQTQLSD